MHGKTVLSFALAFLTFGFLLLALPEEGFSGVGPVPLSCCQQEGTCVDSTEGPFLCKIDDLVENAFCNQDSGLCTQIISERNIPTLSEWGLMAMAGVLGIAGFIIIRRKKAAA